MDRIKTCQHYNIPYVEKTCPRCGKKRTTCPVCDWHLACEDCQAEIYKKLLKNGKMTDRTY